MIERLAPRARRLDEHLEIRARLLLADELAEALRAQRGFRRVFVAAFGRDMTARVQAQGVILKGFAPCCICSG